MHCLESKTGAKFRIVWNIEHLCMHARKKNSDRLITLQNDRKGYTCDIS